MTPLEMKWKVTVASKRKDLADALTTHGLNSPEYKRVSEDLHEVYVANAVALGLTPKTKPKKAKEAA